MFRSVTVRELSGVMPFCQFCHFLIYISARFIYISFTFLFHSLYPPHHRPFAAHAIFTLPSVPSVASY